MSKRKYGSPKAPKAEGLLLSKHMRYSQACDRCRLKKVRCDGVKPVCGACRKVGFQCRTSDKLTRRGFPRGYTEMLEKEVVRLQQQLGGKGTGIGAEVGAETGAEAGDDVGGSAAALAATVTVTDHDGASADRRSRGSDASAATPAEGQLVFVNDSFHLYRNYVAPDGTYLGNATWSKITRQRRDGSGRVDAGVDAWLCEFLTARFQVSHGSLPAALLGKYRGDVNTTRRRVKRCVAHFFKCTMSLVPVLYADAWRQQLFAAVAGTATPTATPTAPALLALLFILQWQWRCFDSRKLFVATKFVCLNSSHRLQSLQCLLLAAYYFLGAPLARGAPPAYSVSDACELLRLAFASVLDLGLFINSHKLVPLAETTTTGGADLQPEERLVTFWCFQFLDSWSTLLAGTPKYNFIMDEFQPPSLASLHNAKLKPFEILLNFVVGSLDGCNLLYSVAQENTHALQQLIEAFKSVLVKYNLYHQLQDHEPYSLPSIVTEFDTPQSSEVQLTLYYLIMKLLTQTKSPAPQTEHAPPPEDTAYEILTLYYLVLVNKIDPKAQLPQQLQISHFMPCNSVDVIRKCLETLFAWATSVQHTDSQLNLRFEKYQSIVSAWCKLWYQDEPHDDLLNRLRTVFKFNLTLPPGRLGFIYDKTDYLNSLSVTTEMPIGKVLFPDFQPQSLPDGFNIFANDTVAPSSLPLPSSASLLFGTDNGQEEDDGYAEDDDDDEEFPLEIPFTRKKHPASKSHPIPKNPMLMRRAGSLFEHRNSGPVTKRAPVARANSDFVMPDENPSLLSNPEPSTSIELPDDKQTESHKNPTDHYALVQGEKPSPQEVGTPRSFVEMLNLPITDDKEKLASSNVDLKGFRKEVHNTSNQINK
ncbi:LAMI_0G06172g1_1 [Lachancea mirantina]|uniref:LAMI_0G06172g1_1 n=1 Tax=Lachancea mirantina TaxID=1230905 RepID=A0A1G4K951_9SACH|nr:LAMI_0G06172g1_1 [Lachancea mirantina]